jgi:hypothetical protein
MNPRTKSLLILVVTLLVGGSLGALATGTAMSNRVEKLNQLRSKAGFSETIERVIIPETEDQRGDVRLLLDETAERLNALSRRHREERAAVVDSMRLELNHIISDEQRERLDQWIERHRARHQHGRQPPIEEQPAATGEREEN